MLLPLLGLLSALSLGAVPFREEPTLAFAVDEPFQAQGGVQLFYELVRDTPSPERSSATFQRFRPLDLRDRWGRLDAPLHVVMSRLVYTLERDVSFFTAERAVDLAFIRAIAPDLAITQEGKDTFRAGRIPANRFHIESFDGAQLASLPPTPALARLLELEGSRVPPERLVLQENSDFDRVMGFRTAAMSVTWSSHRALGPGRTRVSVFTMSYLHSVPPFFLGGEGRVHDEAVAGARQLIERMRAYR